MFEVLEYKLNAPGSNKWATFFLIVFTFQPNSKIYQKTSSFHSFYVFFIEPVYTSLFVIIIQSFCPQISIVYSSDVSVPVVYILKTVAIHNFISDILTISERRTFVSSTRGAGAA